MDSLPEAAGAGSLAVLSRFRQEFHACLAARADGLSELGDAMMLCAEGPVHSLAALSLIPEHRRGHGALYDAVNHGRISITRLRRSLAGLPVPCQNSHTCAELVFSALVTLPRVLADQAVNDLSALDPGGHVDRLARLVQHAVAGEYLVERP